MEIILKSDIDGLGKALDVVNVTPGYAQNYLFPKKLGILATPNSKEMLEKDRAAAEEYYLKEKKQAEGLADSLKDHSITIAAKTAEGDKLYGSVAAKDIVQKLKEGGFDIDRKQVKLPEPIKNLGMYTIKIQLPPDVETMIKLWVISDESDQASS